MYNYITKRRVVLLHTILYGAMKLIALCLDSRTCRSVTNFDGIDQAVLRASRKAIFL